MKHIRSAPGFLPLTHLDTTMDIPVPTLIAFTDTHSIEAACRVVQSQETEVFDAVVCCVGTYHAPNLLDLEGIRTFPGRQMHCHSYRRNTCFKDESVLVVGASFSGTSFPPITMLQYCAMTCFQCCCHEIGIGMLHCPPYIRMTREAHISGAHSSEDVCYPALYQQLKQPC